MTKSKESIEFGLARTFATWENEKREMFPPAKFLPATEREHGPTTIEGVMDIARGFLPTSSEWLNGASIPAWVPQSSGLHTKKAKRAEYLQYLPDPLLDDELLGAIRDQMVHFDWVARRLSRDDLLAETRHNDLSGWDSAKPVPSDLVVKYWPTSETPLWIKIGGRAVQGAHSVLMAAGLSRLDAARLGYIYEAGACIFALVTPEAIAKAFPVVRAGAPVKYHRGTMIEAVVARYGLRRVTHAEAQMVWEPMGYNPSSRTISDILSEHPRNNPTK